MKNQRDMTNMVLENRAAARETRTLDDKYVAADDTFCGLSMINTGGLASDEHTKIYVESNGHYAVVDSKTGKILSEIWFQEGPTGVTEVNGVHVEDLLNIVLNRLHGYQDAAEGKYKCKENAMAITKIEEALLWLRKRTEYRRALGVLGTERESES